MVNTPSIDLNCDLGEGTGADDLALLNTVTSANIACGAHAGDESTMTATVKAALARGVAIGAHPGYPDRANFGRIPLDLPTLTVQQLVTDQINTLARIAHSLGARLSHVKLHGALYHRAMNHEPTALAVSTAVNRIDPSLTMVAMPFTVALGLWPMLGHPVLTEIFADRAYEPDGTLRSRNLPGALITDPAAAAAQALHLVRARDYDRSPPLTLCIHSDTPGAGAVAAAVKAALEQAGIAVRRP